MLIPKGILGILYLPSITGLTLVLKSQNRETDEDDRKFLDPSKVPCARGRAPLPSPALPPSRANLGLLFPAASLRRTKRGGVPALCSQSSFIFYFFNL